MKIAVILGSVREQRQGIKAARFIVNVLKERKHDVELIDPMVYELPLLNKRYSDYEEGKAPENLKKLLGHLREADAFVIVSAEYNHSIPPALTNLLDHFFRGEYGFKPAGIVTYSGGPFGGVRAGSHLRSLLGELGMVSIPTMFPISAVHKSFDDEGKALDENYNRRVEKFLVELEWYANALKEARDKGIPN